MLECEKILVGSRGFSEEGKNIVILDIDRKLIEEEYRQIIDFCVDYGCNFILIHSFSSKFIEDELDFYIEEKGSFDIATVAGFDEDVDEILHFARHATLIGSDIIIYYIFFEKFSKISNAIKEKFCT
ncbi:hypothetical protein [Agrobacterium vitis]|uniref:hypothetical protein n=1 Tax=Agrobacterium vitis TaxID=373 RepID=UPI001571695A|nr:hypothetical protein [Agrobacterium vitis]NSZ15622.1 hypothetical protein [Agrobacterium vitis]QZO04444.1 hypothetical protein K4831_02425 [Agrobacterium vitis]UJL86586.1 hypothetical protein AVF2S5_00760 [Agrobacterium vitis]